MAGLLDLVGRDQFGFAVGLKFYWRTRWTRTRADGKRLAWLGELTRSLNLNWGLVFLPSKANFAVGGVSVILRNKANYDVTGLRQLSLRNEANRRIRHCHSDLPFFAPCLDAELQFDPGSHSGELPCRDSCSMLLIRGQI